MSPDQFNIYSDIILRNINDHEGVKIKGHNITNLRYAVDTVLSYSRIRECFTQGQKKVEEENDDDERKRNEKDKEEEEEEENGKK
ncbi:hypothetical protein PoB_002869100 [Plakobranchus ocellatus]|uniref:Uncharacterized protein n=1 Tax=Plakobranchus ocellatus TaxID=259542 RepID=A0AAV3ZT41_9GAST|nr:hypothetical protein PoB_002869100 [Plakobranchus ocellatus]